MSMSVVAIAASLVIIGAVAFRSAGNARLRGWVSGGTRAVRSGAQAQIELQERYLRAQRPWQADWLRWTRTADGWELAGTVLPPERRHDRIAAPRESGTISA